MKILNDAKEIVSLIQKLNNIELYKKILDLQSEIFKINEENQNLKNNLKKRMKS